MNVPDRYTVCIIGEEVNGDEWSNTRTVADMADVIDILRRYRANLAPGRIVTSIVIEPHWLEGKGS